MEPSRAHGQKAKEPKVIFEDDVKAEDKFEAAKNEMTKALERCALKENRVTVKFLLDNWLRQALITLPDRKPDDNEKLIHIQHHLTHFVRDFFDEAMAEWKIKAHLIPTECYMDRLLSEFILKNAKPGVITNQLVLLLNNVKYEEEIKRQHQSPTGPHHAGNKHPTSPITENKHPQSPKKPPLGTPTAQLPKAEPAQSPPAKPTKTQSPLAKPTEAQST